MNELLAQLFGSQPSYAGQLLGEDEARRLQQQAQQSGLLNVGLALLAGAGPSPQRRGVGELLAQGVMAGQQAYQGAYDKAVRDRMLKSNSQSASKPVKSSRWLNKPSKAHSLHARCTARTSWANGLVLA